MYLWRNGTRGKMMGRFFKGQKAWNEGKSNHWLIGIPRSEETRKKISESRKGHSYPNKRKGTADVIKKCEVCGTEFKTVLSKINRKYCSKKCQSTNQKKNAAPNKGIFKAKTYGAYHYRVRKIRGTPSLCEVCGTTTAKKFEWANLTGRYEDVNDYKRMCTSCHNKYDNKARNFTKSKV